MKYYSETDVKEMIDYAIAYGTDITSYCPSLDDYPHIEILDKHGRLIDADKLTSAILSCMVAKKAYSKKDFGLVKMVIYHIVKAPTVLEASE